MSSRIKCIKTSSAELSSAFGSARFTAQEEYFRTVKMFSSILNTVESLVESWQNSHDTQNAHRLSEGV